MAASGLIIAKCYDVYNVESNINHQNDYSYIFNFYKDD